MKTLFLEGVAMLRQLFAVVVVLVIPLSSMAGDKTEFPFREGDRVAWIGSSSTNIGVWPKTMEFLLRTRHPELKLAFKRYSTGGGTFATGLQNLDKWLADGKPTVVFFNYGTNDAAAAEKGLPALKDNIEKCVSKAKATGARVMLLTPQAADARKSGDVAAKRREMYAEAMLQFAKDKGWPPVLDVFHPLAELQTKGQKDDDSYTILRDTIHLTNPAYIAWGFLLYERLNPILRESSASLTADGKVTETKRCRIEDVKSANGTLTFSRLDEVLPILPPGPLPPRQHVPLEKWSKYWLQIAGLPSGDFEIRCQNKRIGIATSAALAQGVNLNSLLLDSKEAAPWEALASQIWEGKELEQVGKTRWRFEISKVTGSPSSK
jgi:lysophospholipase L1-like esterase